MATIVTAAVKTSWQIMTPAMMRPVSEKGLAVILVFRRSQANVPGTILPLAPAPVTAASVWGQLPDATESFLLNCPDLPELNAALLTIGPQHVTMPAHRMNQFDGMVAIDLAP